MHSRRLVIQLPHILKLRQSRTSPFSSASWVNIRRRTFVTQESCFDTPCTSPTSDSFGVRGHPATYQVFFIYVTTVGRVTYTPLQPRICRPSQRLCRAMFVAIILSYHSCRLSYFVESAGEGFSRAYSLALCACRACLRSFLSPPFLHRTASCMRQVYAFRYGAKTVLFSISY